MNVSAYLDRIGAVSPQDIDLAYITYLQNQHYLFVPFENLDVINRTPLSLQPEHIYEKVVIQNRGGLCFELNTLFCTLLQQLGYDAYLAAGTVLREDGNFGPAGTHTTILIMLDRTYLVDVGFGDSCRVPLPLTGEERDDVSGRYRIFQLSDSIYDLQRNESGEWKTKYRFSADIKQVQDFTHSCQYHQTSPNSPFTKEKLATIATTTGRITMLGTKLITTENTDKVISDITEEERTALLQKHFRIPM